MIDHRNQERDKEVMLSVKLISPANCKVSRKSKQTRKLLEFIVLTTSLVTRHVDAIPASNFPMLKSFP